MFSQEGGKLCEVIQDTNELFVHPIKFCCISSTAWCYPRVYATPFTSLFIYWLVSIYCRYGFVIGSWKSIIVIINFISIIHKIMYTLLIICMNRFPPGIGYDCNLPNLLLLFTIFENICITTFYDKSNPTLNTVHLMVSKVLMFHENKELLPSGDWYDLYRGNNDPTEQTTLVLVGVLVRSQLGWVELAKEYWVWGINALSIFSRSVQNHQHF